MGEGDGRAGEPVRRLRRAVFVDRDGTINPDLKYLDDWRRVELYRGVADGIRRLRSHGYRVICVTNQSGIARGLYTAAQVEAIHHEVNRRLGVTGAAIDAFYYCPHAPADRCACRKPGTELFQRAAADHSLSLAASAIVGDRSLDVAAGERLGLLSVLVPAFGHAAEVLDEARSEGVVPDLVAPSFRSAVDRLLARG